MKKLFFIAGLVLSLLFAPFIFAVDIIQNAPTMPGYQAPVFETVLSVVAADCRDVHEYIQQAVVISNSTQSKSRSMILEQALATFGKDETTFNFKGASVLTDKTVYLF